MYAGVFVHDKGTRFTAAEFREASDELGIMLKGIPIEAHERIGSIERRHAIVLSVYDKLKSDLPKVSPSDRLSLTFRAINAVQDSDTGICPTMEFGVYTKLLHNVNRR